MAPGNTGLGTPNPRNALHVTSARPRSVLYVAEGAIRIESERPVPNRWRRWWYWALLGWKWEKAQE